MKTINANEVTINDDEITANDKNLLKGVRAGVSIKIHGDDGDVEYKVASKHGNKITVNTTSAVTKDKPAQKTMSNDDTIGNAGNHKSTVTNHSAVIIKSDEKGSNNTAFDVIKKLLHDIGFYARKIYDSVLYAYQRVRRGYSDRDLWSADTYQLELMSNILKEYAWNHAGEPADYNDPSNWLDKRDERWYDGPAMMSDSYDEDGNLTDDGHYKTIREYGPGHYAWNEDLIKAATVIDAYSNHLASFGSDYEVFGMEEATRRSKELEKEFNRVWVWIGKHILNLWY